MIPLQINKNFMNDNPMGTLAVNHHFVLVCEWGDSQMKYKVSSK